MSNHGDWRHIFLPQQLRNIVDIVDLAIRAAHHPLTVAVAAQIRCNDVVVVAKLFSYPVPVAAVITAAVNQDHWRCFRISPIYIVQS